MAADTCPWCGSTASPYARADMRPHGGVIEDCPDCGLPRNRPADALGIVAGEARAVQGRVRYARIIQEVADRVGVSKADAEAMVDMAAGLGLKAAGRLADEPALERAAFVRVALGAGKFVGQHLEQLGIEADDIDVRVD